ncbi:tail protein (tape measure) [Rosenbergiella nectarea]|uniref:tail protein (tape measure) n=1 Tax=Rosenbergiella nectarea TaxID=988801 RepID=UPI001BD9EEF4|nr:tail protein (tape measure) [Rosenbergiella nectarea]MBT0731521.1 tail protein (tape measure) [Rosenbergiella nectarea subsp. apis]
MEQVGGIFIQIDVETEELIEAGKKARQFFDGLSSSSKSTSKAVDNLSKENKSTASSLNQIASSAKSVDGSMQTLNTTVSAMALAIQQANTSSAAASMTLAQMNGAMNSLIGAANSIAEAMKSAGSGTSAANSEFNRSETIIEGLGNQLAILDEAQENGARSAAILAAQLRAGSAASDAEKAKIGELTGQLYDMKNGTDSGTKSHGNWKNSMQQAGYQVQDFIVQVQGGQSALVAFAQQGSQLAGAFGPQGAVVGALIALGSVIVGTLINSMGDATDTIKMLGDAASQLDNVITVSQSGVAALSDKYALLASTNAKFGQILKTQAIIEYNQALSKIPDSIQNLSSDALSVGDQLSGMFTGAIPSINGLGKVLSDLNITTSDYNTAVSQIPQTLGGVNPALSLLANTVDTVASKFGLSTQQAFELTKRLNDVANSKSPEQVQSLTLWLQQMNSTTPGVTKAFGDLTVNVSNLGVAAAQAEINLERAKAANDALTKSQQLAVTGSERELALAKATGVERAKLQASYKIQDLQLNPDSGQAKEIMANAVATYNAQQAQKDLNTEKKAGVTAANQQARAEESVAQKLDAMRQKADLSSIATEDLSLEQAKLQARLALGKAATTAQIAESDRYTTAIWQQAAAIKARNLVPETRENDDYQKKQQQLDILKGQTDSNGKLLITQEQYQEQSEQLAQQYQVNLAKIAATKAANVTPLQQAQGEVDPVQQLANQHAQQLQMIKQFESQKGVLTQNGLMLQDAENTAYEKKRTDAMWALYTQQSTGYQALGAAVDGFGQSASSAISGVLTGTESMQSALQNISQTVLNEVINTFVQMGIQWVKSAIMGSQAQITAVGASTAAQVGGIATQTSASVGAAAATTTAWTPAAIMSSVASWGGAVAIGLGAMAGIMALSGKRKNGGPVQGGGMYEVGESNLPEMLTMGGKSYMIPGNNGRVFSNKDITSGAPTIPRASTGSEHLKQSNSQSSGNATGQSQNIKVNIQFIDQTSGGQHQFNAQASQQGDVLTVTGMLTDLDNGGIISSAFSNTFALSRHANGDY